MARRAEEEGGSWAIALLLDEMGGHRAPHSGAQAGPGGSSHRPMPKMASFLLSQPEPSMPNTALLIKNPLAATHEFKQACQLCYPKTGNVIPLYSTPLPRDAGNRRSVESQNDRVLVCQSGMSVGNRSPSGILSRQGHQGGLGGFQKCWKGWRTEKGVLLALLMRITAALEPRGWYLAAGCSPAGSYMTHLPAETQPSLLHAPPLRASHC